MKYYILLEQITKFFDTGDSNHLRTDVLKHLYSDLQKIPQHTFWHPEFDAGTHTLYVGKAVQSKSIGKDTDLDLLTFCAFFHDIGKINRTNVGNKKIWHYDHANESVRMLQKLEILKDYPRYDELLLLIEHHMDYSENDWMKGESIHPALPIFIKCDKIYSREIWREDHTYKDVLLNRLKSFYIRKKPILARPFGGSDIYLPIGISGSGKSKWIREHFGDGIVVSTDEIRHNFFGGINVQKSNDKVFQMVHNRLIYNLQIFNSTVLDATNVDRSKRIIFFGQHELYRTAKKVAIVFKDSYNIDLCFRRIQYDLEQGKHRANVPRKAVERQQRMFRKTMEKIHEEFHEVIFV